MVGGGVNIEFRRGFVFGDGGLGGGCADGQLVRVGQDEVDCFVIFKQVIVKDVCCYLYAACAGLEGYAAAGGFVVCAGYGGAVAGGVLNACGEVGDWIYGDEENQGAAVFAVGAAD